ncbi:retrovirus-related pol polyprotein [Plakobranchus ocellatus]|uniref:Retrovirus-related pol polyprotein n=1 Tax=Plakobranchus ocellatus TaxID=259542 RepID=A0AAV3ZK65_9GAST|nr:retrovirus-related pol polyprotein [Plakobranchus ocellatus]
MSLLGKHRGPESQKKLDLSTHKGILLQKRLLFGITAAPGYFCGKMDQLTQDLRGVAIYLDDILVSGNNAEENLTNLQRLLQRLQDNGLRCRLEK